MLDNNSIIQIFGSLMKHPQYLSESDKYNLTLDDFQRRVDKYIFMAIDSLYRSGATRINPIDVENYLTANDTARTIFNQNNGIEYLQDADYLSDVRSFPYYYEHLKKTNLINSLKKNGIDTSDFYVEDLTDINADKINGKFEQLEINDILDRVKKKLLSIEKDYIKNDTTEVERAFDNIEEILADAEEKADVGYPIQGEIFNEVVSGARLGTLCVRSASSGVGKTRNAIGDACYLAFPLRYETEKGKWVQTGNNQKVLFIATEQNFKEIRKMVLAYLTDINESKFRYGNFSDEERKVIKQALWLFEQYKENLYIVRMPNPTIELVKNIVRENVLIREIQYVFYDYIFIGPSLLNEFKGFNLRNDEILLMFSTALKDLAVELNICVMTSTQVNANADNNTNIRNESTIAGSRSIINKADTGCVIARPTKEELEILADIAGGLIPNMVTDIYKVRSGEWNQVRIWSYSDLGTMRRKDLFITDARFNIIENFNKTYELVVSWEDEDQDIFNKQLKHLESENW